VDELREWYSSGQKRYPEEITPEMFRLWYVTDGWNRSNQVRIRCKQQSDEPDYIISLVQQLNFVDNATFDEEYGVLRISNQSSREFWRKFDPLPSFEYKWPSDDEL
jgi:hypothetical protein